MFSTAAVLFAAGLLTILLPCILPLVPVVVGVSIAGRSKWRPLLTVMGMVVSFVGFTFLLQVVLAQFYQVADYSRLATYAVLLLFGAGFLGHTPTLRVLAAGLVAWFIASQDLLLWLLGVRSWFLSSGLPVPVLLGVLFVLALLALWRVNSQRVLLLVIGAASSVFFAEKGWLAILVSAVTGMVAMELGGLVAARLQQLGSDIQQETRSHLGKDAPITAFVVGLTLGLVWVPCAGPALGFALTLVREKPGLEAFFLLLCYALGTAVPLLLVGYGGQWAVHSVRAMARYAGRIKQVAGVLLVASAIAFQTGFFADLQTFFVENTGYGTLGTRIEEALFGDRLGEGEDAPVPAADGTLPVLGTAPELVGLGPWFNGQPLTMDGLKGKVVLVDFWTYSCINCIRTLPYLKGYWEAYKDSPFVLIGVHAPEFAFEAVPENVQKAIAKHALTYPVAMDNDFETWKAFKNQYWPAKYLIDAEGRIRYAHFGEGDYEETDAAIRALLAEAGASASGAVLAPDKPAARRQQTPEIYLGARSWNTLFNATGGPSSAVVTYAAPTAALPLHRYALVGDWQLAEGERQVLRGKSGEIRLRFQGGEANLVLGTESGTPVQGSVRVDGGPAKAFSIPANDLYELFKGDYGEHELVLTLTGEGAEGFAFTFGS